MNSNIVMNKIRDINSEDNIWLIYIVIIILSWYANSLERNYFLYNDIDSKNKYQKIMIFIFSVLLIVYLYFFKSSLNDLSNLKVSDTLRKKQLTSLSALGSLFIVLSGILFLYIAYNDKDIDVEIAFN